MQHEQYDIIVVGGGLAGLSAAILMKRKGFRVLLIEKEDYPLHRVCGEYVSLESLPFLQHLGCDLSPCPVINELVLTAPSGKVFTAKLPLGGIGISRFALDHMLFGIAEREGVEICTKTKVLDVEFESDSFLVQTGERHFSAKLVCGAFGKRSSLDVKWQRPFLFAQHRKLENYVGVKYHVEIGWPAEQIGLHNFRDGYCGISRIEEGKYCVCYLTSSIHLKRTGSIPEMEKNILSRNPHLKRIFEQMKVLPGFPVTISQISFAEKEQVREHMLMLGDAAGMITPLCGNGMSIALHSAALAARCMDAFLRGELNREQMEARYTSAWQKQFSRRLSMGRYLQRFFGREWMSNAFISFFRTFPGLSKPVIKMTHGEVF